MQTSIVYVCNGLHLPSNLVPLLLGLHCPIYILNEMQLTFRETKYKWPLLWQLRHCSHPFSIKIIANGPLRYDIRKMKSLQLPMNY